MPEFEIKYPGPDHPITITANPSRIIVRVGGRVVADSRNSLTLTEASYPGVHYIPRRDVDMTVFSRTHHHSFCPYKGHASYFDIAGASEDDLRENAAWSYEFPHDAVASIVEYIAFYPDRVDAIEEWENGGNQ